MAKKTSNVIKTKSSTPDKTKTSASHHDPFASLKHELHKLSSNNVTYSFGKPFNGSAKVKIAK